MPQAPPATQNDAQAFCDLCQWVYECWITLSHLFESLPERLQEERNVSFDEFAETAYGRCLGRLNEISQQYSILQIAKLHDPARQRGNENLSIEFFVKQEFWSEEERSTIEAIALELDGLYTKIEDARNKILAHNDRSVFAKGLPLGSFPNSKDENYFLTLAQLCSMIWEKFPNGNWPYGARVFDFTKSGICGDPLCPSSDAKEMTKLILSSFPKPPNDVSRV